MWFVLLAGWISERKEEFGNMLENDLGRGTLSSSFSERSRNKEHSGFFMLKIAVDKSILSNMN